MIDKAVLDVNDRFATKIVDEARKTHLVKALRTLLEAVPVSGSAVTGRL